jgi:hypothetical protein
MLIPLILIAVAFVCIALLAFFQYDTTKKLWSNIKDLSTKHNEFVDLVKTKYDQLHLQGSHLNIQSEDHNDRLNNLDDFIKKFSKDTQDAITSLQDQHDGLHQQVNPGTVKAVRETIKT